MAVFEQVEKDFPTGVRHIPVDHVAVGFARLLEQDRGDPYFEAVLGAYLEKLQEISDVLNAVQIVLSLRDDVPTFVLDAVGTLLDIPRSEGWDDDTYRFWLRARVAARKSSGTYSEVLRVAYLCRRISGALVQVRRLPPKAYQIEIPHLPDEDVLIVRRLLRSSVTTTTQIDLVDAQPGIGFYFDNPDQGLDKGLLQELV